MARGHGNVPRWTWPLVIAGATACLLARRLLFAAAPFPITQTFMTGSAGGWVLGGNAALTSGTTDTVNAGWLRLQPATANSFGWAYYNTSFSTASPFQGMFASFEFASWGGSGADGLVFFLYDGSQTFSADTTGGGGTLGYAGVYNFFSCNPSGIPGAYVGVGFDEYGNFQTNNFGCPANGTGNTVASNSVTARGSSANGYPLLATAQPGPTLSTSGRYAAVGDSNYRKAFVSLVQNNGTWWLTVSLQAGGTSYPISSLTRYVMPSPPATLKLGVMGATGGSTNIHEIRNLNVYPAPTISGTVFEDINYGGGAGRSYAASNGVAVPNARVELYDAQGNYVYSTTTNASGQYSFSAPAQGNFTVRVVNGSVVSTRVGSSSTLLGVQTYRTDASSGAPVPVTDHVGGESPALVDAGNGSGTLSSLTTSTTTAQSVATVAVGTSNVTGVDFGYNFDTIVNPNDSGQGSLRQWLTNVNAFTDQTLLAQSGSRTVAGVTSALPSGTETSIFMVSNGTAVPGLRAGLTNQLPLGWVKISQSTFYGVLTSSHVALDGATQTANVGDTNPGTVGTGGTVGVSATPLAQFDKPEVELHFSSLVPNGSYCAVRSIALSGGPMYLNGASCQVTDVLVGMDASGTSSAASNEGVDPGIKVAPSSGITVHHNYIRVNNSGIRRDYAGGSGLLIEYNEIDVPYNGQSSNFAGMSVYPGSNDTIQYNLIKNQVGSGYEVTTSGATNFRFQENTLSGNGVNNGGASSSAEPSGMTLCGTTRGTAVAMTIYHNVITASGGPGIDVMCGTGFKITQNSTYNNGVGGTVGLGIDLDVSGETNVKDSQPRGVTPNSGTTDNSVANNDMNFPMITSASVGTTTLTVAGYVGKTANQSTFANATVEFFKSSLDATGYGEGQTYLGTLTTDSKGNFSGTITFAGGLFSVGNSLTATATDPNGNTSEFGPNFVVNTSIVTLPSKFNAFESSTAAGAVTGVIQTKIAGTSFSLDIVAVNTAGTGVLTTFTGAVTLQLLDASNNTGTLAANGCRSSWVNLGSSSAVTFAAANNGRLTATFASVADAWRDVRVQMSTTQSGSTVTSCSGDDFAIRPNKLAALAASDTDWATAGTGRTLSNGAATGGNVHKAGQRFTLTAQAQNSAGTLTSQYTGTPAVSLTCLLPSGCGAANLGTLTFTNGFVGGTLNATDATYSEVGAFTLLLTDTTFAAVDAADSSTAQRYIVSDPVTVGRFVPDHFSLTAGTTGTMYTFGSASCATRSFTYVGQTVGFKTVPTVTATAQNATGATTQNYAGALFKLTSGSVTASYGDAGGASVSASQGSAAVSSGGNGTASIAPNSADTITWARSSPVAPFVAQPTWKVTQLSDTSETGGSILSSAASPTVASSFDAGAQMYFGRLYVGNAFGLETLALSIPIETQYWTGKVWATNASDTCSSLSANALAYANWQRNLGACETSGIASLTPTLGKFAVKLSAPGSGNAGSVDLTVNVGATAAGSTCVGGASSTAATAAQPWLQGNWGGSASYTVNPTGRASFGVYAVQPGFRREQ